MTRKRCAKCKRIRLVKFFWPCIRMKSGLMSYCKDCAKKCNRASSQKYQKTQKRLDLARRCRQYGLTVEQYEVMEVDQGNVCAICGRPEVRNRRLSIDHDHKTGKVRGLLCSSCNPGLGSFQDSPDRLRYAAMYLEKYDAID